MQILDCTFRDGGYLTNWYWDKDLVSNTVAELNKFVDYIELGYRSPKGTWQGSGPHRFTTEDYCKNVLKLPKTNKLVLMIDLKEYIVDGEFSEKLFDENLGHCNDSIFSHLRIAINFNESKECIKAIIYAEKKCWHCMVSIMKFSTKDKVSNCDFLRIKSFCAQNNIIPFIADSFGAIENSDEYNIKNIDIIGLHLHNNKNKAYYNALCLEKSKTYYGVVIDSTLSGAGRGAGNIDTIDLLKHKNLANKELVNIMGFLNIIADETGRSVVNYDNKLLYYIGADYNMHPNYITYVIGREDLNLQDKIYLIDKIKDSGLNIHNYHEDALCRLL